MAEYHLKESREPEEKLPIYLPLHSNHSEEPSSIAPLAGEEKNADPPERPPNRRPGGERLSDPAEKKKPPAKAARPTRTPPAGGGSVVDFPRKPPPRQREREENRREEKEEEILHDTIPFPVPPRRAGPEVHPDPELPPEQPRPKRRAFFRRKPAQGKNIVPFPEEKKNPVAAGLAQLRQRADEYAEHMFEEEGTEHDEEVRRAETFIPGVDEEDERPPRRERKPRRPAPPAPDLPPQQLFRRYSKGLKMLRLRTVLTFLTALLLLYLTAAPYLKLPFPELLEEQHTLLLICLGALLGLCILLGIDVWLRGLLQMFCFRMGMDSLMALSCLAAMADTFTMPYLNPREGHLPYCAAAALSLGFAMAGTYLKRQGQRIACRTAAAAPEPYLVTLDEGTWNGRDTYVKWSGAPLGFGSQIQASDGAERIFHVAAPLLLICCVLFSAMASVGQGRPQDLIWSLSATLSSAASFSGLLCYGLPWYTLSQRLSKSGAALAGWDGTAGGGQNRGVLLTDTDLFPTGMVCLNGIKVFGDFPVEKVVAVTATLIRDSGSGLDKVFHDLLRSQGAIYRRCSDFCCYEGGGLSATVRNEMVLVGSASFMNLMEVALPQGLNVKNAVFCAIDGELAGIFALTYQLHSSIEPALNAIIRNRIVPVLATRDFNIIPAMLHQRFKLPADKMEFPPVVRRIELSAQEQEHNPILTAVLCRPGLAPYSEVVVGSGRLHKAVRGSAALTVLGAAIGVLLAFYITFSGAYTALSPLNLLVFLAMWLVPTWLISGWVNRY